MRIISGLYKSRVLKSPPETGDIRPTTDRSRETLFNIIQNRYDLAEYVSVDLFCGTGSFGLECISRGAPFCYFVDNNIKTVKENIALLEVGKECLVYKFDVLRFILNIEFDDNFKNLKKIIFADPPYSYKYYTNLIEIFLILNLYFQKIYFCIK